MRRLYVFLLGIGNIQTQFSVEKSSYHPSVFSVDRIARAFEYRFFESI